MVTERIRTFHGAGVNTLRVQPMGRTLEERLETLGRVVDIARGLA
jgi:hypothetical protein